MPANIIGATAAYEGWLKELTDVQRSALARKHDQMSKGPLPLLRATFYHWINHWEKLCPELHSRDEDVLLAVADLHLENFGIWLDSRRRLIWGINDFDEACELPFTNDLVRLATSVVLAEESGKISIPLPDICKRLLEGYRDGIERGGEPILVESGRHPELKQLAAVVHSPRKFWKKKLNPEHNPRIRASDLPPGLEDVFRAAFVRTARPEYRRQRQPGGLGSLGRRRFTAIAGEGASREAREAKALVPSASYWRQNRSEMVSQTGTLLQRAIRSPDPHLQIHDKWLVRRIGPDALKINLMDTSGNHRLVLGPALLRLMGFETANIHLGSRSPEELMRSLERLARKPGQKWLEQATERMANATRKDHQQWVKYH